ncbi:MAG: hypothetical protein QOD32_1192 [Pyrinomonadaceae bacterium]|nr:hypothetical protein [Pyrinomonadaceae bacterium]
MRKTFVCLTLAVIFCALALLLSTPHAAAQQPDPCVKCLHKVEQRLNKCIEKSGGVFTEECGNEFNQNIVDCYATVCEQKK